MPQSVRSLAAEAGISVDECARRLGEAGFGPVVGGRRLDGQPLAEARSALGLGRRAAAARGRGRATALVAPPSRALDETEMVVRLLRPLREKGKVGRNRTTAVEHLYGHGIPDHQKHAAKELVEALVREGCLDEKVSQGRRHFWLTGAGQARLSIAERLAGDGGGSGGENRGVPD